MKLSTLLEYQRAFNMLREAERNHTQLSGPNYVDVVKAEALFDYWLKKAVEPQEIEVKAIDYTPEAA